MARRLNPPLGERICGSLMGIQKLFAVLVALAVLFAPAFTRAGAASAAPADHHSQMMEAGHCKTAPAQDGDRPEPAQTCCVSMCMAVATAPTVAASHETVQGAPPAIVAETFRLSLPPEIATPPPRHG